MAYDIERFATARRMARNLPGYDLQVSLKGPFWNEMERVLQERILLNDDVL